MQTNYKTGMDKKTGPYGGRSPQSNTPAGSFDKIKGAALDKLADKKVISDESPKKKALEIHSDLLAAINSGNTREVHKHLGTLNDHIRQHGLGDDSHDKETFKRSVKSLRDNDWGREYERRQLDSLKAAGKIREGVEVEHEEFGIGTVLEESSDWVEVMVDHGIEKFEA